LSIVSHHQGLSPSSRSSNRLWEQLVAPIRSPNRSAASLADLAPPGSANERLDEPQLHVLCQDLLTSKVLPVPIEDLPQSTGQEEIERNGDSDYLEHKRL